MCLFPVSIVAPLEFAFQDNAFLCRQLRGLPSDEQAAAVFRRCLQRLNDGLLLSSRLAMLPILSPHLRSLARFTLSSHFSLRVGSWTSTWSALFLNSTLSQQRLGSQRPPCSPHPYHLDIATRLDVQELGGEITRRARIPPPRSEEK
jgi:hypothetical protein